MIGDEDIFIADLVGYWSIMHLLKSDLSYIEGQFVETSKKLELDLLPEEQRSELAYE